MIPPPEVGFLFFNQLRIENHPVTVFPWSRFLIFFNAVGYHHTDSLLDSAWLSLAESFVFSTSHTEFLLFFALDVKWESLKPTKTNIRTF